MRYTDTGILCRNGNERTANARLNLTNTVLSKGSQTQQSPYGMIPHKQCSETGETNFCVRSQDKGHLGSGLGVEGDKGDFSGADNVLFPDTGSVYTDLFTESSPISTVFWLNTFPCMYGILG